MRSDEQQRLLHASDGHPMRLRTELGETDPAASGPTGTHHDRLRMWADA